MVRRSGETSITLPPTRDWRALEQIRWSKLERDNEMFKKIQRHRYMNIIRSIQLEKSIKIKQYNRMEEKLNSQLDRLTRVKQLYKIPIAETCVHQRKAKSCPIVLKEPLPSLDDCSSKTTLSNITPSTSPRSLDPLKSLKNEDVEEVAGARRPPSMAQLTVLVQNFLEPLCPVKTSMVSKQYQDKLRLTKSQSVPGVKRPVEGRVPELPGRDPYKQRDHGGLFRHRSFYLTT